MAHVGVPLDQVFVRAYQAFNAVRTPADVDALANEYFDQSVTLYQLHSHGPGHFYTPLAQVIHFLESRLPPPVNRPQFYPGQPNIDYWVSNTMYSGAVIGNNGTWTEGGKVDHFSFCFTFVNDPNNPPDAPVWLFSGLDGLIPIGHRRRDHDR